MTRRTLHLTRAVETNRSREACRVGERTARAGKRRVINEGHRVVGGEIRSKHRGPREWTERRRACRRCSADVSESGCSVVAGKAQARAACRLAGLRDLRAARVGRVRYGRQFAIPETD